MDTTDTAPDSAEAREAETPREAVAEADTSAAESSTTVYRTQEEFDRAFTARLERERAKLRREYEAAGASMSKLEQELGQSKEALSAAEQGRQAAERMSEVLPYLGGLEPAEAKKRAVAILRLASDEHFADGFDAEAFFTEHGYLRPDPSLTLPSVKTVPEKTLTRAAIAAMSPEEFAERREEIYAAQREGRIKE